MNTTTPQLFILIFTFSRNRLSFQEIRNLTTDAQVLHHIQYTETPPFVVPQSVSTARFLLLTLPVPSKSYMQYKKNTYNKTDLVIKLFKESLIWRLFRRIGNWMSNDVKPAVSPALKSRPCWAASCLEPECHSEPGKAAQCKCEWHAKPVKSCQTLSSPRSLVHGFCRSASDAQICHGLARALTKLVFLSANLVESSKVLQKGSLW
jgi:hypothetical protein